MRAEGVRFRVLVPCNDYDLINSPELPGSIYDSSEELFRDTDLDALRKDVEGALGLSRQARWEPQRPQWRIGLEPGLLRYNRVEGLSLGSSVDRVLGAGYTTGAVARIGVADLEPNAELFMARSNVRTEVRATAYRRLVAANDWGNPFGLGASAVAAIFGRDDGFYYRSGGAELGGSYRRTAQGSTLVWRLFGERQDIARTETHHSLAHLINGTRYPANIVARSGAYFGGAGAVSYARGADPMGTRLSGALRAEAAAGQSAYGRFLMEHVLNQGLPFGIQGTMTGAAGSSMGDLPPQRLWYLGDAYTVRGHRAGTMAGDAFWLARAEVAKGHPLIKPTIFGDAGWAGSRNDWARQSRPMLAAGAGAAAMDGLLRLDVSRGLSRGGRWRADFYLEVR